MIAAFATSFFFALSVVFAARSARHFGSATANLGRMLVALVLLGIWAQRWGQGVSGASLPFFVASGVIGFGFGDIALYEALPRIGARLTILLNQCLAAPIATLAERLWLGTTLTTAQICWTVVILFGVALAVAPDRHLNLTGRMLWTGTIFGIFAAFGQALGAVFSRKAYQIAAATGTHIDGGTAAYQRMLGGIVVAGVFFAVTWFWPQFRTGRKGNITAIETGNDNSKMWQEHWRTGAPWIFLNALAGPVLGIACYQHALATTASGVVLPIVAISPVIAMALAFIIEGERPSRRSLVGGVIAVIGSIALA